jgi:hypothetical protein
MYKMDDERVNDLASGLRNIVRNAQAIIKDPEDNQHRLEDIVSVAKMQLKHIKDGSYKTKATQRMHKPRIG